MLNFAIYKYVLIESEEKELFRKDGPLSPQDIFGGLLGGKKLNLYRTERDGTVVTYPNDIVCAREGVTVMRVCNVKDFTYYKDYKQIKEVSNPWCIIVIDNRPGVAQIAIEHSASFDGDPGKPRTLLWELFHRELSEYGLNLEINAKMRTEGFWDTVEWQCRTRHDTVRQVVLEFPNPRTTGPIDAAGETRERLELLADYLCAFGAVRGSLRIDADKHGTLSVDKKSEDLAQMVALCGNNGYTIAVHFREMGVYRYGDHVMAMNKMQESLLADFESGQKTISPGNAAGSYALIQWLDDIREQTKNYDDAKPTPKSRKKNRRAAI